MLCLAPVVQARGCGTKDGRRDFVDPLRTVFSGLVHEARASIKVHCGGLAPPEGRAAGSARERCEIVAASLVFFSKDDCPLCDKGLAVAQRLAARHGLRIEKVDIESDPTLMEKYAERVPVLELDGAELGWGLLSERAIERKLESVVKN